MFSYLDEKPAEIELHHCWSPFTICVLTVRTMNIVHGTVRDTFGDDSSGEVRPPRRSTHNNFTPKLNIHFHMMCFARENANFFGGALVFFGDMALNH